MADKTFDDVRSDIPDDAHPDSGQLSEGPNPPTGDGSEGPSGTGTAETSVGGADSIPATPDTVPYTPVETDTEPKSRRTRRDGSGDGLNEV